MSDVQAEPSSTEPVPAPAEPAPIVAEAAAPVAAAPAPAPTLEQRMEALEGYLMKLPHSIAHALSISSFGTDSIEEIGKRALAHLFGKQ